MQVGFPRLSQHDGREHLRRLQRAYRSLTTSIGHRLGLVNWNVLESAKARFFPVFLWPPVWRKQGHPHGDSNPGGVRLRSAPPGRAARPWV